jgi:hypothetical protein
MTSDLPGICGLQKKYSKNDVCHPGMARIYILGKGRRKRGI